MASQTSHIVYGTRFLEKFLNNQVVDRRKFYIGTLFPDIRYLGLIDREITHSGELTIEAIKSEKNDFEKGRLIHCLVDLEREKIVNELNIHNLTPRAPMVGGALEEELGFVSVEIVERWHNLLGEYFSESPTLTSIIRMAEKLTITDEEMIRVKELLEELGRNQELIERLRLVYAKLFEP